MIDRTTRLRWRRRYRHSRGRVEGMSYQAEEQLEKLFFKRLSKLAGVRRFLVAWVMLLVLLTGVVVVQLRSLGKYYLSSQPVEGGIFEEGILGSLTNANPIYAVGPVDSSVAKLIFSGLFKYDDNHNLVNDLAESWSLDERGTHYTVKLKPNLTWHDGLPLTSADVVYTYQSIQNPDAKSPFAASWQGITITAPDTKTIVFELPNPLGSFIHSMTNGIVPRHLLADVPSSQLRSVSFNTNKPIGSGPFMWEAVEVTGDTPETREQKIALIPNEKYHFGKPKLNKFVVRSFHDEKRLINSFNNQELNAAAGLANTIPETTNDLNIHEYNVPLLGQVMVFLRTTTPVLGDVKVRQALTMSINAGKVASGLGYPVLPSNGPLLQLHVGYDRGLTQMGFDPAAASKLLDEAGWPMGPNKIRVKDGKTLTFTLYTQSNDEYSSVARMLQKQWMDVGVDAQVFLQPESELQGTISNHNYDSLLYGISLGVDPDVFPYWHSTQADIRLQNRLNFSEYKSSTADKALEAGRTRSDPTLRAIKYRPFLEAWRTDAPAIALYQPRFLYISRGKIYGFNPHAMNSTTDRYSSVEKWMIREDKLQKPIQ